MEDSSKVYIVGDDNLPISTDLKTVKWYEMRFHMKIPYFQRYDDCIKFILKNK